MIVLLDNYDSFTYNLYQILAQYDEVKIFRNDKVTLKEIEEINPKGIIISPGPGRPENAGILIDMVKRFKGIYFTFTQRASQAWSLPWSPRNCRKLWRQCY